MARQNGRAAPGGHHEGPENTPRLRLKPKAPTTGHVDGAWWPRSDDLATELPDLLAVLSVRLGAIDRVMYNLAEWAMVPTATDDRRAGGSTRRIPAATSQYPPSARGRPRKDPAAGRASAHRAGRSHTRR